MRARAVAAQERTKNATVSPFSVNAEPGPGLIVNPSSGIRDARMAYRLQNGSLPRASFTLAAVGYKDPGDHDSMALLQHAESDARKSSAMTFNFTARPYNLTSHEDEAEKHEQVFAPDSEDGQDRGDIKPGSVQSRWRGKG
jgi:hypothetical protein